MINRVTLAAACLLSTSAAAAPVEYPAPVAVPDGLILTLNEQGHPSFNPADGVHQLLSGKAGSKRLTESVDWSPAPDCPESPPDAPQPPGFPAAAHSRQ